MSGAGVSSFDAVDPVALEQEQLRLAALTPPVWRPANGPLTVGGAFVAFAKGEQGPGKPGDHAFVGAAATRDRTPLASVVVVGVAPAAYRPGYLAAREGNMLQAAVQALRDTGVDLDVVLIDATGRDHLRRAGLALQLGAVLDVPTVGVTLRALVAEGPEPEDSAGSWSELTIDGEVVAAWLRPQQGVRPIIVHAAWRTGVPEALEVVRRVMARFRTPEPLRLARMAAREARAHG